MQALQILLNQRNVISSNEAALLGKKQVAIATRVVHHFRMILREAGAMKHMTADARRSQARWVSLLTQRVFDELPTDLRLCSIPVYTGHVC